MDASPDFTVVGVIIAVIGVVILEFLCYLQFFRHGLDDAFIIGAQLVLYATVAESYLPLGMSVAMMVAGLVFAIRYVSALSFLVFMFGIVLSTGIILIDYTTISSVLPFVLLLLAVVFFLLYKKVKGKDVFNLYENTLYWFFIFSLVLGYASVNYFVVRTLSEELLAADYSNAELPFGWVFYGLMFVIPVLYVCFSLKAKNRTMLYIGVLAFAISVATFRYYHSILPAEWALLLGGLAIFAAVYVIIQRIKSNETGITFKHDHTNDTAMLSNVEALIVNSQDLRHTEATDSKMDFGGGGFSGGGSGGNF